MTTRREIQKWVQPLLEAHPQLALAGNTLIFWPFGHVLRGVAFFATSYREFPNVSWFLCPTFVPVGLPAWFSGDIPVGSSEGPAFHNHLCGRVTDAITRYLLPNDSIEDFHDFAIGAEVLRSRQLYRLPLEYPIVLAALGRFSQAEALLTPAVTDLQAAAQGELDHGRRLLANKPKSLLGKQSISSGERDLRLSDRLVKLLGCLRRQDRAAIASLLLTWESEVAQRRKVAQYWQPTPFPFETG